jgi:hypothetical protein
LTKAAPLVMTQDLATFHRANQKTIMCWIAHRLHTKNAPLIEDVYQNFILRLGRLRLLERYNHTASAFTTYTGNILHQSITAWQHKEGIKVKRQGKFIYNTVIDRTVDIDDHCRGLGMDSDDIAMVEAKYDVYKFFAWYKLHPDLTYWRKGRDIEIIKLTLLGEPSYEIASKLGITKRIVTLSLSKVRTLYKVWLKEVAEKDKNVIIV